MARSNRQTAGGETGKARSLANLKGGSRKGVPNKNTAALKDMILKALDQAGGAEYLARQAEETPTAFLTLVGKVLPLQVAGDAENPLRAVTEVRIIGVPAQ